MITAIIIFLCLVNFLLICLNYKNNSIIREKRYESLTDKLYSKFKSTDEKLIEELLRANKWIKINNFWEDINHDRAKRCTYPCSLQMAYEIQIMRLVKDEL